MTNRARQSILAVILLAASSLMQAGTPIIEANGSQLDIEISDADPVSISISMIDALTDPVADWWIVAATPLPAPDDLYYFNGSSWTTQSLLAFHQAFIDIDRLEALNIPALPPGVYTFYFGVDLNPNGVWDLDSLVYDSVQVSVETAIEPTTGSCGTATAIFTVSPMQSSAYFQIDPRGATNPSAHTFPTVHTYMMLSDNSVARDVFAPGNMTITQGEASGKSHNR